MLYADVSKPLGTETELTLVLIYPLNSVVEGLTNILLVTLSDPVLEECINLTTLTPKVLKSFGCGSFRTQIESL